MTKSNAEALLDQHQALLGRVTIAWNDCTRLVFELFIEFSGLPLDKADVVFFGIRNDRTQRQIVRRLASLALAGSQPVLEQVRTTLGKLDQTAEIRNEATHSAWAIEMAWRENEHGITIWRDPKLVKVKSDGDEDDGFTERFEKLASDLQDAGSALIDILRHLRVPAANS